MGWWSTLCKRGAYTLFTYLPANTPYILGHVVDRGCDTPVESFVVHSPNIGARRVWLQRKSKVCS